MKAIITTRFGPADFLQLADVPKPIPGPDEILVKVQAATVTRGDVFLRKLSGPLALLMRVAFGVKRKPTPGHEFAGVVEAIGADVTRFRPGDAVFGTTTGLSAGANAEYVVVPENGKSSVIAHKPANLSFDEAAALPVGALTALYLLRKGGIQAGQQVLIIGASGSVGSYAVQIARHFGAEVTGVVGTENVDMARALGVQHVIDYKKQDVFADDRRYDLVFDTVAKADKAAAKAALTPGGAFVSTQSTTSESLDAFQQITALAEAREIRPFIDRRFSLAQTAEAHRYVETGRKRGNVIITVNGVHREDV